MKKLSQKETKEIVMVILEKAEDVIAEYLPSDCIGDMDACVEAHDKVMKELKKQLK